MIKQVKRTLIFMLVTLPFGLNGSGYCDDVSIKSILISAVNAYISKAKKHEIFKIKPEIYEKIKLLCPDELEAHKKLKDIIRGYVVPKEEVQIPMYTGELPQEDIDAFADDIGFELEVPLSIVQSSIEEQLQKWKESDCAENYKNKIEASEYVLKYLQRIDFNIRLSRWFHGNKQSKIKDWIKMLPSYKAYNQNLEKTYRILKHLKDDPEEEVTGEEVVELLSKGISEATTKVINNSTEESEDEKLAKEIIEHINKAVANTHELYSYAISGITEKSECEKEAKLTELVFLLEELFQEIGAFQKHLESGLKEMVKKLDDEYKATGNDEAKEATDSLNQVLNAFKTSKIASTIADFILESQTTAAILIRKGLGYKETDSLMMRLAKKFV